MTDDGQGADGAAPGAPEAGVPEAAAAEAVTGIELPPEHPAIAPLSFLLGRWKGTGKGDYPTIKPFNFFQEVAFSHIGKPYLIYTSRSRGPAAAGDGAAHPLPPPAGRGGWPKPRTAGPTTTRTATWSGWSRSRWRRASGGRSQRAR